MTSTARLRFLIEHACTIVFATPTYALHLAELAAKEGIDLAGEPGAGARRRRRAGRQHPGDPRQRIESVWGARVFDHYGMTEVGPVAVEAETPRGQMYLLEARVPRRGRDTRTATRRCRPASSANWC